MTKSPPPYINFCKQKIILGKRQKYTVNFFDYLTGATN